jgi:hypothetical protein
MKAVLCLFVKNEVFDLPEWLVHHLSLGFDRVIVYDNMSTDGTSELIARLTDVLPIEHIAWPDDAKPVSGLTKQGAAYTDCIERHRGDSEWLCFLDSDEFLIPPSPEATIADLIDHAKLGDAFAINWMIFGSGGVEDSEGRLVMEAFDRRSRGDFNPNRHVKMLFRPEVARRVVNPHFVETDVPCRDLDGDIIAWSEPGIVEPSNVVLGAWRLHHYFVRSRAHWRRRLQRRQPGGGVRDWEMFHHYDRNDVIDVRAVPFAGRAKEQLAVLGIDAAPAPEIDGDFAHPGHGERITAKQFTRSPVRCVLDAIDNGQLRGWAVNPDRPDRAVTLRIEIDQHIYHFIVCDLPRKDVLSSEVGAEFVGFRFTLPADLDAARPHTIRLLDINNKPVRFLVDGARVDSHSFVLA